MEEPPNDRLIYGVGLGCLSQLAALALAWFLASRAPVGKLPFLLLCSWGLTQWIALVPLILQQRAKDHPRTMQGLLITGAIGLLLSSACAGMILR